MSLKKQAVFGLGWTFVQQFGNQLIGFVVSLILARLLTPEDFGLIGMITVLVAIGNALLQGGLTKSLIRSEALTSSDYSTVFYFNLASSVLIYLIAFFFAPLIAKFYSKPVLVEIIRMYCITFIISAFSAVQLAILTRKMDFKSQTLIAIPASIVGGATGIVLALLGYGVWSLVWSSIVTAIANVIQLWIYSGWWPRREFSAEIFKRHFNYGYKLTISELLDRFFNNIFLVVIGKYFAAAQVGLYTRAETMKQLPVNNISKALDKVTFPLFVSIQNEEERLKKIYKKIMQMVIFLVTPILVLLAVLAEPTFRFLFTEKWLPAVPYFQILCVTGILYPLHSYNLSILNVKGRSDLFLRLEVFKKIIIVITLVVTIPFGIMALLYGQVAISVIAFFINAYYTAKFINYSALEQLKDILPSLIIGAISGFMIYYLDIYAFWEKDVFRILFGGISGLSIYLCLAFLLRIDSLFELNKLILKR